ncbi:Ubiquitin-associated protein [Gracilaria domingensis]|nr:Ubiquitin-associated protein [Gracilaria domingensis]
MERFIRDKYENKRYITVENGGLGGQTVSRNRSSRLAPRSTPGSLGPRPAQSMPESRQAAYDSAPTVRKTGMSSISYGGRFSRPVKPMREPQRTVAVGKPFTSSTGRSNAIQRASTLKQLLTMGFPQDVAVKAVEAGDGDLQRSLDWVLQQDGKSMNQARDAAPPRPLQKDLLDFDEPSAPTAPTAAPQRSVPKVMATESLISSTAKDSSAESNATPATNSGFADFADFGGFQQTLPSAVSPKGQSTSNLPSTTTPKNTPLTSSLANLYKKSPPNPTTAPSHISPFSQAVSPLQFPNSSVQAVSKTGAGDTHKNEDSLGLTTFESLSPQNLRLTGKTIPSMRLSEQKQPAGVQAPYKISSTNEPPPPPPPPEHMLFPGTLASQPPPPSPQLESNAKQTSATQNLGGTCKEVQSDSPGSKTEAKEETPKNNSTEKEEEQGKKEEEVDPFAALSMMALSSATSAQKKRKANKASSLPKTLETSSPKGTEVVQNSINLDELLS